MANDFNGLLIGVAKAPSELTLDALLCKPGGDLRTAPVNHNRLDANKPQIGHVLGEGLLQLFINHRITAELNDDDAAVKVLEPVQRLDQGLCLDLG